MLSIAVIGYNRIRSLYVTLCSIFKMKGIEDIDVSVYLDGKLDPGHLFLLTGLINDFPIKTLDVSPTNLGIRNNILRALRTVTSRTERPRNGLAVCRYSLGNVTLISPIRSRSERQHPNYHRGSRL